MNEDTPHINRVLNKENFHRKSNRIKGSVHDQQIPRSKGRVIESILSGA